MFKVLLQGSVAIDLSFKNSDVDLAILVPNYVGQHHFFEQLPNTMANNPKISDILLVTNTFIPIIKATVNDIPVNAKKSDCVNISYHSNVFHVETSTLSTLSRSQRNLNRQLRATRAPYPSHHHPEVVDMARCTLGIPSIPKSINFSFESTEIYRCADLTSIYTVSGVHLAQVLREILSNPQLIAFARLVRYWATMRCLSTYVYGFPSGTAWNIMTAYICLISNKNKFGQAYSCGCLSQQHPTELPDQSSAVSSSSSDNNEHRLECLLYSFFLVFAKWNWSVPVQLYPIPISDPLDNGSSSWYARNKASYANDLMPVLTPCYPHKNTASLVRPSTAKIIRQELQRGLDALVSHRPFDELFEKYELSKHYKHFLMLSLTSSVRNEFNSISGLIDSRIRDLAVSIETQSFIDHVRIQSFDKNPAIETTTAQSPNVLQKFWLLALSFNRASNTATNRLQFDATQHLVDFYQILSEREPTTNFHKLLSHQYLKRSQLVQWNK